MVKDGMDSHVEIILCVLVIINGNIYRLCDKARVTQKPAAWPITAQWLAEAETLSGILRMHADRELLCWYEMSIPGDVVDEYYVISRFNPSLCSVNPVCLLSVISVHTGGY